MSFFTRPFAVGLFLLASCLMASQQAPAQSLAQAPADSQPPAATPAPPQNPQPPATPQANPPQTSPPQAGAPGAEAAKSPNETAAVVIDGSAAAALLGKPVQSLKGENLGRVVDVIVDRNGMMRAAIIDFGGFLGVGTRKIAVDWRALHFPEKGGLDKLTADLPRDQLRMAPVFKEGEPIVVIGGSPGPPAVAAPAAPPSQDAAPAQKQ